MNVKETLAGLGGLLIMAVFPLVGVAIATVFIFWAGLGKRLAGCRWLRVWKAEK